MACISKLTSGFAYDCDSGNTGIVSALLLNKSDITSFVASGGGVDLLSLREGATAFKIDTPKRTLVVSESLKVNEGAPNAFTHSATLVVTAQKQSRAQFREFMEALTNGSFVLLIQRPPRAGLAASLKRVYGLYYGMSPTAIDASTHDNGSWTTITLSTPENVIGEDALVPTDAIYDDLMRTAVY